MKKFKNQLLWITTLFLFGPIVIKAQDFQGVAKYEVVKNLGQMAFQLDDATKEMKAQITEMLRNRALKEFVLNFNVEEASWREINSQEVGLKYRNITNNQYLEEASLIDERFLIEDELPKLEWVLTDETKLIGAYTAKKATSYRTWQSYSQTSDLVTDTLGVEAWYIPEIPAAHGPDIYGGLPGLILELKDGKATYLCISVTMNPEQITKVTKPSSGRKVSKEEYKKIRIAMRNEIIKGLGGR